MTAGCTASATPNGDDRLDKVELLRKLDGGGEHGPHAVILAPDGRSLYVVAGNATEVPGARRLARARGSGARTTSCPAWSTAAAS